MEEKIRKEDEEIEKLKQELETTSGGEQGIVVKYGRRTEETNI